MYYNLDAKTVLRKMDSNQTKGLNSKQVEKNLKKYGQNKLAEKKKKSFFERFLDQFKDAMIIILIIAAGISFATACIDGNLSDFFEPTLILFIVIINAVMGAAQESKAEKSLEALKNLSSPKAKVIRGGKEDIIDASTLVPGDIIKIEAGDFVPADARLLESTSLKSEESALTGESIATDKDAAIVVDEDAPLGERKNMVFSGCCITYGTATAVVTATGMNSEIGKIANLLNEEKSNTTPLQQKLAQLGKFLGVTVLIACAVIFLIGLANHIPALEIFMTSISLAVSAIPEGLPTAVTIILALGVQKMVKSNAIVRRLPAVETLGNASIICSDKTGTLTQNRMTLLKAYSNYEDNLEEISNNNSQNIKNILTYASLCCNGSINVENGNEKHIGDPTETAIISAALKNGIKKEEINEKYPRLAEIPFDSNRKLMTTINSIDGKNVVIVKGAYDVIKSKCITKDFKNANDINSVMGNEALRVLAVAYKEIDKIPKNITPEDLENDLTFMGLVGMIDPPRPEAEKAVKICKKAGIKPIMITGDHILTAKAIAKKLGIFGSDDKAITGKELDEMTDLELEKQISHISVYARVSPENKIRIVKAWQKKGKVVAMTGDGVNDAPALKFADIGCAMGITGTDVAKNASDIILTNDNFSTIVSAVREGRGIYANIKKVIGFLLGTNLGELICVFLAMIFWHKPLLLSMQLLWVNLITDSFPAIALGAEAIDKNVMNQKPKSKNEGIFAKGFGLRIILQGIMFGALSLFSFYIAENVTGNIQGGQTMAFIVLALSSIVQSFNMRSENSLFKLGFFTNKQLNLAALTSILLLLLVLFTPMSHLFSIISLPTDLYLYALLLSLTPFLVMEISKKIKPIKY